MRKKSLTLIEMMLVIFLIGIITAVVGYNMKGSLDKGKVFKTEQGARKIREILLWEYANRGDLKLEDLKDYQKVLEESSLIKKSQDLLVDGWGKPFEVKVFEEDDDIEVFSPFLEGKKQKKEVVKDGRGKSKKTK